MCMHIHQLLSSYEHGIPNRDTHIYMPYKRRNWVLWPGQTWIPTFAVVTFDSEFAAMRALKVALGLKI